MNPLDVPDVPQHPTGLHRTDCIVTEIITDSHGFRHAVTHCLDCGCRMTSPIKEPMTELTMTAWLDSLRREQNRNQEPRA